MKSFVALIAAAGVAVSVASAASAQDMMTPAEEYFGYRAAVVAYERCNGIRFNLEQSTALENRITDLMTGFVSPSQRLAIIEDARDEYSSLAYANGCGRNDRLQAALETFETELSPALGM